MIALGGPKLKLADAPAKSAEGGFNDSTGWA